MGQMGFKAIGESMDIDHGGLDTDRFKPIQNVVDERPTANFDQGLGPIVGQRPHPRAQSRGHHHGGGRTAQARASAGTYRSNQVFRPANDGSARLRSR